MKYHKEHKDINKVLNNIRDIAYGPYTSEQRLYMLCLYMDNLGLWKHPFSNRFREVEYDYAISLCKELGLWTHSSSLLDLKSDTLKYIYIPAYQYLDIRDYEKRCYGFNLKGPYNINTKDNDCKDWDSFDKRVKWVKEIIEDIYTKEDCSKEKSLGFLIKYGPSYFIEYDQTSLLLEKELIQVIRRYDNLTEPLYYLNGAYGGGRDTIYSGKLEVFTKEDGTVGNRQEHYTIEQFKNNVVGQVFLQKVPVHIDPSLYVEFDLI